MGRITAAAGAVVTLAVMAAAPAADAANSCSYNASLHRVSRGASAGPTSVSVRRSGNNIQWRGGNGVYLDCGAATVTNTDEIIYLETGGNNETRTTFEIDLSGGQFAPGFTSEGIQSEIEFTVGFGDPGGDALKITAGSSALDARFGVRGVNLNTHERGGTDRDVSTIDLERPDSIVVAGSPVADEVSGAGGLATDLATQIPMIVTAGAGADAITGGLGADNLDVVDSAPTDAVSC